MSRNRSLRLLACGLAAAIAMPGLLPAQDKGIYGRNTVVAPERTDAGDWYGTWFYNSRTRKIAVWIDEKGGEPRMKVRLQDVVGQFEGFTTDWDGQAEYELGTQKGVFSMKVVQRDENTIAGSWVWNLIGPKATRKETADFTIYRSGAGRQLVWKIEDLKRYSAGQGSPGRTPSDIAWTFKKASRRQALWGELPF